VFALFLMGMWIEFEECYSFMSGGPLAENSPPNSLGVVLLVLVVIGAVLYLARRSLGLRTAEFVVIYAALLVAAPMMTQGMWHRFFGLLAALPHEQDFKTYESLPEMLWPHGKNLCVNGRFVQGLDTLTLEGMPAPEWGTIDWQGKDWKSLRLTNRAGSTERATLVFRLPRTAKDRGATLVPGESYLFSCLVKASGLQKDSYYFLKMQSDRQTPRMLQVYTGDTTPTFANRGGGQRIGVCPVVIPTDMRDSFALRIGLNGPGTLLIQDVQFFNVEAIQGAYTGVKIVRQRDLNKLAYNERDFTLVKPDQMFSVAGLLYLLQGFIPLQQWLKPAIAWTLLIGALFMGFMGFNVLMRRQWVENERFMFPLNLFPRVLFGEDSVDTGDMLHKLLHNRALWLGVAVMLPLVLLKGLKFYYPAVPAPVWGGIWGSFGLDDLVTNPLLKQTFQNATIALPFTLLAIALVMETDILFSIWSSFLLFQLVYLFGKMCNFYRFEGYPWEFQQEVGAFIAFALLSLLVARRHLGRVFQHIIGKIRMDESQEVVSYRTAVLMILGSLVILAVWGVWTKMGAWASLLFFGWILICGFAASKIRAEVGMPWGYWTPYYGIMFLSAVGGFVVFGATGMLVATIASGFMCVVNFLFIAPAQVEMMELGRHFKVRPRDIGHGLMLGLLGGLFIGGFVLLCWAYGMGGDNLTYTWPYQQNWYFDSFRSMALNADRALATGTLTAAHNAPLDFVHNIDAKGMGIGFVITCLLALLRSVFMWFPFHPLGYVLGISWFGRTFWFTALVAWLIRILVLRIGGTHTIRKGLIPFSIGMFVACLISVIIFDIASIYLRSLGMTHIYNLWP